MEKVWQLYLEAIEVIEKKCQNKCYHLGYNVIQECIDYIKDRLINNDFKDLKRYNPNHKSGAKPTTYLHTLIRDRLIDFFNSAKKRREFSAKDSISNGSYKDEEAIDYETIELIKDIIQELSFEEQVYIQYKYYDGLSHEEIGRVFNKTRKQVDKKIENIKIKLKRKLKKIGLDLKDLVWN